MAGDRWAQGGGEAQRRNAIFKGDKRGGREIHHTDPEFKPELGRMGKSFVQALDEGSVPEAFLAWCRVFDCEFEEIQGLDGGEWVMAKEMTWELFQEVLHSMPKGKAAGEGGFTVELLRAASRDIQFGFFEALINDVNGRVVPKSWHSVLYALLPKPAPNDNALVGENREIALMPVDMKMFLQMIRWAAHAKRGTHRGRAGGVVRRRRLHRPLARGVKRHSKFGETAAAAVAAVSRSLYLLPEY